MITHSPADSEAANQHIMSSFLMNTAGSYGADPKFLSSPEDYSHTQAAQAAMASSTYMTHGDYYSHQAAAHGYPGYPGTGMGIPGSHQASAAALSGYGRGTDWSSTGYYQQCSAVQGMQQQMQMHQMMQAASGHLSPLNQTGSHLSGSARSPVSSPQPQMASNNVLNHGNHDGNGNSLLNNSASANSATGGGGGGNGGSSNNGGEDGYPSPQHPGIGQPQLTPGGGDGGMSSDCSDDESSPQSNRQMPVVYPWMKKIHVGGVGKNQVSFFLRACPF